MKSHHAISLLFLIIVGNVATSVARSVAMSTDTLPVISKAPVSYRVNDGAKLHGYYQKGYDLTIYGDTNAIGYRADCDEDDDWSGATAAGTTQSKNSFETRFHCVFNPHQLFGTVLPGNARGQNHFDGTKKSGAGVGDLAVTYKLDQRGTVIDSVIGVVFDRGPHNQPGEASAATCAQLKGNRDNNQYAYIIFPNTARYLKQVIGTRADNDFLKRDPTNADFKQAYQLMGESNSTNARSNAHFKLLQDLSLLALISNFDNATPQEKAQGKLKPKNNNRNVNE